jgi:hypothetical protein
MIRRLRIHYRFRISSPYRVDQAPRVLPERRAPEQMHDLVGGCTLGNGREDRATRLVVNGQQKTLNAAVNLPLQIAGDGKAAPQNQPALWRLSCTAPR